MVKRLEPEFLLAEEKIAFTQSYTYLEATFARSQLTLLRHHMLDFPMDMQPLVPLKENMHIKSSASNDSFFRVEIRATKAPGT